MTEKLDYYDLLGIVVPGVLLILWIPTCFPSVLSFGTQVKLSPAFDVIAYLMLAVFLGHIVQAIASNIELLLFWSWGGKPSNRAFQRGLGRYLPIDTATRIKEKLAKVVGPDATTDSLFLYASTRTDSANIGLAARFHSLYAYHRALFVLVFLAIPIMIGSKLWGAFTAWSWVKVILAAILTTFLLILIWYRTKQRSYYYVREVLMTCENILDEKGSPSK